MAFVRGLLDRAILLAVFTCAVLLVILANTVAMNLRLHEMNARLAALNSRLPDIPVEKH